MKYFSIIMLLISLLAVALYAHTLSYGYVYLDDTLLLRQSASFLKNPRNIAAIFRQEVFTSANQGDGIFYRPILTLSFFVDTQLFGDGLVGYRVSNLFLHILAAMSVYLFLKQWQGQFLAGSGALLFTVHPMLVAAVAWVPGRNDLLLTVWVLAAWYWYWRWEETGRLREAILHSLFFILAVLTKETALVLPVLCLTHLTLFSKHKRWHRLGIIAVVWGAGTMGLLLARQQVIHSPGDYSLVDMMMNMLFQLPGLIVYIGKAIAPFFLSVYPDLQQASLIPGIIVCLFLSVSLLLSRRKRSRVILFACLWVLLFLLPTMTIREKYSGGILREHRMYLPMAGILLLLGEIDWIKNLRGQSVFARAGLAVVLGIFFIRAWIHVAVFSDSKSFWKNAVATSSRSPVAHLNLGAVYAQEKQWWPAEQEYTLALLIAPDLVGGHNNLGVVYLDTGRYELAQEEFRRELSLHPDFAMAERNLDRAKQQSAFHP